MTISSTGRRGQARDKTTRPFRRPFNPRRAQLAVDTIKDSFASKKKYLQFFANPGILQVRKTRLMQERHQRPTGSADGNKLILLVRISALKIFLDGFVAGFHMPGAIGFLMVNEPLGAKSVAR